MANGDITPPEAGGQTGPEATGAGGSPRPPEPPTPGQQTAAEAEAEAREEGPGEALEQLAKTPTFQQFDERTRQFQESLRGTEQPGVTTAPLREVPPPEPLDDYANRIVAGENLHAVLSGLDAGLQGRIIGRAEGVKAQQLLDTERQARERTQEQPFEPVGTKTEQVRSAFENVSGGMRGAIDAKVAEYAERIRKGENPDEVLEGLGPSWRESVNKALNDIDGEGRPPIEPPEPQPAPENVEDVGRNISQEVTAEAQRAERYARMPQAQRDKSVQIQQSVLDKLQTRKSLTLDPNEVDAIDVLIDRAQNEISSIESAPPPPDGSTGGSIRVTQEDLQAATRRIDSQMEDLSKLSKMNVGDLTGERDSERANLEALNRMLEGPNTNAEKVAIQARIRDSEARIKAIADLRGKKEPEEQRGIREKETQSSAEELEAKRRETGNVPELTQAVEKDRLEVEQLKEEIKNKDDAIKNAIGDERIKLENERAELARREVAARDRLITNKEALESGKKRVGEERGLKQKASSETVRTMTVDEFNQLEPADRVKYFQDLADALGNPDKFTVNFITGKLETGQNLSFEEAGMLVNELSESLFKEGRKGETMRLLHLANAKNPELALAVLQRFSQRKDVQKQIDEALPGVGKKIWEFAKSHPGWMMILLAIIAGGAAAVGAVVAPAAGIGVGLAGSGAAGAGGYGAASRRGW